MLYAVALIELSLSQTCKYFGHFRSPSHFCEAVFFAENTSQQCNNFYNKILLFYDMMFNVPNKNRE